MVICGYRSAWKKAPCAAEAAGTVRAALGTAAPPGQCLQHADPRPLKGIINSASPTVFVLTTCWESIHPLGKGFSLASAQVAWRQPPLERPDCFHSTQNLVLLSSGPSHRLLLKHQGDQPLSLVSAFQVCTRMTSLNPSLPRVMVERAVKVMKKIAESCRVGISLETNPGNCLITG